MILEQTAVNVRGITMNLVCHTRALRLCARMNRELEVLDFIDAIPLGAVFYDLGACEGRFSLYAALRGVRTFSFEPEEQNFGVLQENIRINDVRADLLRPFRCAVGRKSETAILRIGQPWAGGHQRVLTNSVGRADLSFPEVMSQQVDVVALDDFIEVKQIPVPNYLKIDVDGSELAFLEGARQTLRNSELRAIVFELCRADEGCASAIDLLADAGFVPCSEHLVEPGLFNIVFQRRDTVD
jgi:FkbM family methyltransferase